ncbi:hypothetical protein IE53DRAFT_380356 [Violaceomyces palustris]|uniref:Uncharacterized protein n=1 Tax=Violaceomyces palustris TaxID=1673888 RepID=A0ACD0NVB2_9BASI|nr:hypothetical protein IE53DRAFT_380356 [Violaceomyces palustris]
MEPATQADLQQQIVHSPGLTRIAYAPKSSGVDRIITSGDDFLVRLLPTDPNDLEARPLVIEDSTQPVTWIDVDSQHLVVASEDGCVRLYRHLPDPSAPPPIDGVSSFATSLQSILRRESLPVRCVAIEKAVPRSKSPRVVICSDELIIRIVEVADPRKITLLTGHQRGLRSASWSPVAPLLVTCSTDGSARVWDLATHEPDCIKVIDGILPASKPDSEVASIACWHPSGNFFVFPSKAHEIVMISASTSATGSSPTGPLWVRTGSFSASDCGAVPTPSGSISSLAFCPNGRYLAVGTSDGQVTVWETSTRKALRAKRADALVTSISWHPSKDVLAWTDNSGGLTRWTNVMGPNYPSPFEEIDFGLPKQNAQNGVSGLRKARDAVDDIFEGTGIEGDDDDEIMADREEDAEAGDGIREFVVDDVGHGDYNEDSGSGHRRGARAYDRAGGGLPSTRPQPAFQPNATPMRAQRRYLAFNMLGTVTAVDQDTHQTVSFESFDTAARRNFRITDHHHFSMASLNHHGVLFACKKQEDNPSSIYFKPFETWNNSGADWSLGLPVGEEVEALAMGGGRVVNGSSKDSLSQNDVQGQGIAVVATSKGYLRFFSASGMQLYIWALGHSVVTMVAGSRSLLVVHRANGGAFDGYQNLGYSLIELSTFTAIQEGSLPIGKNLTITWAGFNEQEVPGIFDSAGTLFTLDRAFRARQGRWVPSLDTKASGAASDHLANGSGGSRLRHWPVGLTSTQLMVVFVKGGRTYPEPDGTRHLIQELELHLPFINRDTGAGQHEEKSLRDSLLSSTIRDAHYAGVEDGGDSPDPSALEMSADKSLLQLIQLACKADKHARALDAARNLHSGRTLDAALQIAAFFHLPSLAERLTALKPLIEEKRERQEDEASRWCEPDLRGGPLYSYGGSTTSPSGGSRVLVQGSQDSNFLTPSKRAASRAALKEDFEPRSVTKQPRRSIGSSALAQSVRRERSAAALTPTSVVAGSSNGSTWNEESSPSRDEGSSLRDDERGESRLLADKDMNGGEEEREEAKSSTPCEDSRWRGEKRNSSAAAAATGLFSADEGGGINRDSEQGTRKDDPPNPIKIGSLNPFAPKPAGKANPFARTQGTVRDNRSMHKSNSFFERVDAVTQNGSSTNHEGSVGGGRRGGATSASAAAGRAKSVKQSTLLGFSSSSDKGGKKNSTTTTTGSLTGPSGEEEAEEEEAGVNHPTSTPAFGETQYEDEDGEESLRATLRKAAEEEEMGNRLQETLYPDEEESETPGS